MLAEERTIPQTATRFNRLCIWGYRLHSFESAFGPSDSFLHGRDAHATGEQVSLEYDQEVFGFYHRARGNEDIGDFRVARRVDGGFHFHRFDAQEALARFDRLPLLDRNRRYLPRHGRRDVAGIIRVGLGVFVERAFDRFVFHANFARLAVELEKDRARAIFVDFAGGQITDDQRL